MQILVTSPIPSHPQNHGNRARVFSLCRTLQERGYSIHFVYGGLEGLSQEQELAMRNCWEHVYIVRPQRGVRKQSRRKHHLIDDWYVPEVSEITARILKTWKIDYCLANYVWFSRWLEDVPTGIPKYLDTHDMFADRHKRLKADGMQPSWYNTTKREEAKALKRADCVLAIQSAEASFFEKLSKTAVRTLGHYVPANYLPKPTTPRKKLKVGYLASNNPINQHALSELVKELSKEPALHDRFTFELAGAICSSSVAEDIPFTKHGFVESAESFYAEMDIILNPNLGGTGLKIKSVEALAYGKPLLATHDAMIGIPSPYNLHQHADVNALVQSLKALDGSPDETSALATASQEVFSAYQKAQLDTLDDLFPQDRIYDEAKHG